MEKYTAVENMIFAHNELKKLTNRVDLLHQMLTKEQVGEVEVLKCSGVTITSHHMAHIVIQDEKLAEMVVVELIKKTNYRIAELKLMLETADKAIADKLWRSNECDLKTTKS